MVQKFNQRDEENDAHMMTLRFVDLAVTNSFPSTTNPRHSLLDASNRHRPTGRRDRDPLTEDAVNVVEVPLPDVQVVEMEAILKHVTWTCFLDACKK